MNRKLKITLLMGGNSSEREISLRSGAAVSRGLKSLGHQVVEEDVQGGKFNIAPGTDIVFLALHGRFGEDGEVQSILSRRGIPYTGCDGPACRRTFNKLIAKEAFSSHQVPVAKGGSWSIGDPCPPCPCVFKPVADGSSVGVYPIFSEKEIERVIPLIQAHGGQYMWEEWVEGSELTVGILGDQALPIIQISPRKCFYDYQSKYTQGATEYLCPAPLSEEESGRIQQIALSAFHSCGCRVVSRVDIIRGCDGRIVVLEINAIPGMTELSLLPRAAKEAGFSFPQLCEEIVRLSLTYF